LFSGAANAARGLPLYENAGWFGNFFAFAGSRTVSDSAVGRVFLLRKCLFRVYFPLSKW